MPIKIHHGPPGAYKTSGAIKDDLIPWAIEGRVVVTNVRGLGSTKKFKKRFAENVTSSRFLKKVHVNPTIPKSFKLVFVDTESSAGKERMRTWFMWAPKGCAFLIDEIQTIYPQKYTPTDYKALAYESPEAAQQDDNRPEDVYIAFEKHRHYNWDFVVTAPSIKKVPAIIRDVSEVAYYHSNKGKIGLKGMYLEAMHNPDDSGKSESQWIMHNVKRAPKQAFALYGSTDTGVVKDTESGKNIFLQPKIIGVSILFLGALVWNISKGNPFDQIKPEATQVADNDLQTDSSTVPDTEASSIQGVAMVHSNDTDAATDTNMRDTIQDINPLGQFPVHIGGTFITPFVYVTINGMDSELSKDQLVQMGYSLTTYSNCMWKLDSDDAPTRWITCKPDETPQNGNAVSDIVSF